MATYSQVALESFLRLAPNYADGAIWAQADRCAVSEVDGVCAWKTPQLALEYALVGNSADIRVAVFDGVETGPLPEPGGVCARVSAKVDLLDVAAFKTKYCRMPPE